MLSDPDGRPGPIVGVLVDAFGADGGRPGGVPGQVPQDGGRPVRLLPRQRLPVLRRRGDGRRPWATSAPPRLDPGRPARRELRHLHGLRRACWSSTSTTSTRPTSAHFTWDLRRFARQPGAAGLAEGALRRRRSRALIETYAARLPRPGRGRSRDADDDREFALHARQHRGRASTSVLAGRAAPRRGWSCSTRITEIEDYERRLPRRARRRARLDDDERDAVIGGVRALPGDDPGAQAPASVAYTSRTSSGAAGLRHRQRRAARVQRCSRGATTRRWRTTSCCR